MSRKDYHVVFNVIGRQSIREFVLEYFLILTNIARSKTLMLNFLVVIRFMIHFMMIHAVIFSIDKSSDVRNDETVNYLWPSGHAQR